MFSPLALTQALPFLPLAQGDIDYQTERRDEPGLIDDLLAAPATKVILTRGGRVAVPKGQGAIVDYENVHMRLATLPGAYVRTELATHPQAVAMFLGSYGGARDEHVIAVDITRVERPATPAQPVPDSAGNGADDAFDEHDGDRTDHNAAATKPSLLEQAVDRFDWVDLRGFAPHASAREAGQATNAIPLSIWHNRQRFCPTCGSPVETAMAGWAQRCTNAADGNRLLFPRVEPAVITAIVDSDDRLLLQHNVAWKDARLYSVSAGFVEAGENLEHAARREAKEEVGLTLGEVRYLGSQPWPFPASLMMAFKAHALTTDIHVDGNETMTARWVTRDEYTAELVSGRMVAPGKATIARYMIEEWYGREL
ncbi:NUDIX family hydrolase [Bifidobacterium ramosum]|uniref:NAD(+) diphosphatase n=1 Tax=Bifidobacterium ramosum TaxID=1798158 RepID=A0A6L4X0Q5_9BIFI|nr:NAD(+) diphosphatase [Bifidobacterium ramosum]KAB8287993.1 NUDIX family hydrolase [Bifidobacterium ramosum]NEG72050.1 NAD(+) diphosphatase [Bifidobacterium ramosum]